jgi:threonine dehydrogenase-like Zn-dependent dehydrogenase
MSDTLTARQFWVTAPGHGEIIQTDLAPRQPGEVLVRAICSGISRGTESLVFRGEVPASQHEAMRAPFQEGDFPAPVKYGYASVGEVEKDSTSSGLDGRVVFCLYPHQDLYAVPAQYVTPVPDGVPAGRAVLAANMESAVTILWDARPAVGDRIVVIGAGVLGLLVAWLCRRLPGTSVIVVDVNPERASVARALDIRFASEPEPDADLVIHASGQPDGLRTALRVAGVESTVVEASWYGDRTVSLPLGEDFHSRRLTLKSSQVGRLTPDHIPRWTRERRMRTALELLRRPELDVLITGESAFEDLPDVMMRLSHDPGAALCHRIRYRAAGMTSGTPGV